MVERFVFGDKFNQLAIATAYIWKKITLVLISGEIDTLGSLNINTFPSPFKWIISQKRQGSGSYQNQLISVSGKKLETTVLCGIAQLLPSMFSRHWTQETFKKTCQFSQLPDHRHFWGHIIHILQTSRHEDLPRRSSIFLQNPGIKHCRAIPLDQNTR